jgi:hypothetical protein
METKKITGADCLDVIVLPGIHSYSEDTQMKGQKYKRFAYNGVVFIVNAEDKFCADFDKGEIYAISFGLNAEGQFSYLSHNSYLQVENLKRFESKIKSFDRIEVVTNPEELAGL